MDVLIAPSIAFVSYVCRSNDDATRQPCNHSDTDMPKRSTSANLKDETSENPEAVPENKLVSYHRSTFGSGIAIEMGAGTAVGVALGNVAVGIGVGIGAAYLFARMMAARHQLKRSED